jgi:hypothetical protein
MLRRVTMYRIIAHHGERHLYDSPHRKLVVYLDALFYSASVALKYVGQFEQNITMLIPTPAAFKR